MPQSTSNDLHDHVVGQGELIRTILSGKKFPQNCLLKRFEYWKCSYYQLNPLRKSIYDQCLYEKSLIMCTANNPFKWNYSLEILSSRRTRVPPPARDWNIFSNVSPALTHTAVIWSVQLYNQLAFVWFLLLKASPEISNRTFTATCIEHY